MTSYLHVNTFSGIDEQFNDVWMPKKFEVLYFAFHAVVCVSAQLCAVDELERNELLRLCVFGNCPSAVLFRRVRRTLPKEPSPSVLTMRKSPSLAPPPRTAAALPGESKPCTDVCRGVAFREDDIGVVGVSAVEGNHDVCAAARMEGFGTGPRWVRYLTHFLRPSFGLFPK